MRLFTVIPVMGIGGAEAVASALILDARRRGHAVRLASSGGFRADDLSRQGIPHIDLTLNGRRLADLCRTVVRLRSAARQFHPDVVHAHNIKAALVARLAFGRSATIVTTLHGVPPKALRTSAWILARTSDVVVAVSPYLSEQIIFYGLPPERVVVIENSIAPLERHVKDVAKGRLGLGHDTAVVLCLARLVSQKRHDLLVRAWEHVPGDVMLLIAGDGPTRSGVEDEVQRLGIAERVRFLGERTDPDWLLAASDLLVLPTDWEGLPISLLEAMGSGVPVVVSRVGGVIETLGDAVRLVEPGSTAALTDALRALLADPDKRSQLRLSGERLVAERFSAGRMLDAYDAIFTGLTDSVTIRRHS